MTSRARVITESLGGSPLSIAAQTRRLPAALQLSTPRALDEWREHVDQVRGRHDAGWYARIAPAIAADGTARRRLDRVVAERGIVVTTGQQAALYGGPLYTLAKALTALAVADEIEQRLGVPAAPVFWGATDDADFLEARSAYVADTSGLHELALAERPAAGTMMSAARLGDTRALASQLRASSGSAAHRAYVDLAVEAFGDPERTIGDAYIAFLRALLQPLGIAVLDSSHDAYREAAGPLLSEALHRAPEISTALGENAAAIRAAGFEPQVLDDRGLSLVFEVKHGVKRRLTVEEGKRAKGAGERSLAPNVLLRPIVERELLPTVGYVAGPGELAYFVQSNAVAAALERPTLTGLPRWSTTIIEPHVDRALRRLGVEWFEVKDLHALERRLAAASLPGDVTQAWKQLRETLHANMQALQAATRNAELLPDAVVEGLERSLSHRLSRGERRILAAAKRKDDRVRTDLLVASAGLYPMGSRQERVLNYVPMLAREGPALLEEMRRAAAAHASGLLAPAAAPSPPVAAR